MLIKHIMFLCSTETHWPGQAGQAGFVLPDNPTDLEPVEPKDIAVLVNNRNEAAAVRDALGRRRIKSVYLSDRDSVLTSREANEVLCWLRAFAEPRQLAFIRAALATPWDSVRRRRLPGGRARRSSPTWTSSTCSTSASSSTRSTTSTSSTN